MNQEQQNSKLKNLIEVVELPDRAYESAQSRYVSLGEWLSREGSALQKLSPYVFVQGSFGLGTAIRPLHEREEYDLDLTCSLNVGISRATHSQEALKNLVGAELEEYRKAKRLKEEPESKHRCWRLHYSDEMRFHMDVVPSIPLEAETAAYLEGLIEKAGSARDQAAQISRRGLWITDDRLPSYRQVRGEWLKSNPEGYIEWFRQKLERSSLLKAEASVKPMPLYQRKAPLQRAIQLLKRHRDVMFTDRPDSKPISIIITTIAADSVSSGTGLAQALWEALDGLERFRASGSSFVPNPTNPEENFADKWGRADCAHLALKENFHTWIRTCRRDFAALRPGAVDDDRSGVIEKALKIGSSPALVGRERLDTVPRQVKVPETTPRPWRR